MGTVNNAPAEVLIVSELIRALPVCGSIIPETPVAEALLIIAPKFRVSVILSNKRKIGVLSTANTSSIKVSRFAYEIGEMVATAP